MKRKKEVYMQCPQCGAEFEAEPIIMLHADGSSHMEHHHVRTCKFCGSGLNRRVRK